MDGGCIWHGMAFSRLAYLISRNRFQRKLKSLYRKSRGRGRSRCRYCGAGVGEAYYCSWRPKPRQRPLLVARCQLPVPVARVIRLIIDWGKHFSISHHALIWNYIHTYICMYLYVCLYMYVCICMCVCINDFIHADCLSRRRAVCCRRLPQPLPTCQLICNTRLD